MENLSNKDKLLGRILDDAASDAAKTMEQAQVQIGIINSQSEKKIAELIAEHTKKRDLEVAAIIDGKRTAATLAGSRESLKSRRELIDTVFEQAYDRLLRLDDFKKQRLFASILSAEAVDGDVIVPAAADRELIKSILPKGLQLSAEDAACECGFCIIGKGYEKDCSMKAVLAQLRADEETAVAKRLFG